MTLPLSPNTAYSAGTQIKSVDLNDIQDEIVRLDSGKHTAAHTISISALRGSVEDIAGTPGTWVKKDYWVESSAAPATAGYWLIPIELPVGSRILSVDVVGVCAGAGTDDQFTVELYTIDLAAPATAMVSKSASSHASGSGNVTVNVQPTVVEAIDATHLWYVRIDNEANGSTLRQIMAAIVEYDAP